MPKLPPVLFDKLFRLLEEAMIFRKHAESDSHHEVVTRLDPLRVQLHSHFMQNAAVLIIQP